MGNWPAEDKKAFATDMVISENFIGPEEEESFLKEVEPYLKRLRYEFDHWDDVGYSSNPLSNQISNSTTLFQAIHGFRETERKHWYPANKAVIEKIREIAFYGEIQPYVHVLDLAKEGVIKPHVDSVRYCGSTIAGISLLSDCVMRMVRVDENTSPSTDDFRTVQSNSALKFKDYSANVFLPRYSLYIMRDTARFNFTHEILENKLSVFQNQHVEKDRRISIICRNEPK